MCLFVWGCTYTCGGTGKSGGAHTHVGVWGNQGVHTHVGARGSQALSTSKKTGSLTEPEGHFD